MFHSVTIFFFFFWGGGGGGGGGGALISSILVFGVVYWSRLPRVLQRFTALLFSLSKVCDIIVNTLRLKQNGCHFADDIFKLIIFYEIWCILILIPLKFVPKVPVSNKPALIQLMVWHKLGETPLSEPVMFLFISDTYKCLIQPPWVNNWRGGFLTKMATF